MDNLMETVKRKILVVLVDRANYGRMKMVLKAIEEHPQLELLVMCTGSMVLARFGSFFYHLLQLPQKAYLMS